MNEQKQHLYKRAALLGAITEQQTNELTYEKTKKFAHKLFSDNLTIAFAGHFSSGKSSMINALTGENLLATSPIPTSANIVTIQKSAEWKAYIHFLDGHLAVANEELAVAKLKKMTKDGQSIRKIELFHPETELPEQVILMDTPGVDSTDDAHRLSTESELHLADLVFYVMDYNHVQSELNFTFTKELMRTNPNVYLIINQMDKHRPEELTLDDYKTSVADAFKSWEVYPKGIFFTSLKDRSAFPVDSVQKVITQTLEQKQDVTLESAQGTLQKLIVEHDQFLKQDLEEVQEAYEGLFTTDEWTNVKQTNAQVHDDLQSFELLDLAKWKDELQQDVQVVMSNSYTMTPEIREQLKEYAEASQPQFKVGFFSSKKKTEEEKQLRLNRAVQSLTMVYQQTISSHVDTIIAKYATILQSPDETHLPVRISEEVIASEFKSGTSATGDGLLQFASRVERSLHKRVINTAMEWAEQLMQESNGVQLLSEEDQLKKETLQKKKLALQEWMSRNQQIHEFSEHIKSPHEELQASRAEKLEAWENDYLHFYNAAKPLTVEENTVSKIKTEIQPTETEESIGLNEQIVVGKSQKIIRTLHDIPNFKETVDELKSKVKRIQGRSYTIALFGAFSAGKSSFSNALLGNAVLPVSPNPTTASINKIAPVRDNKPHRHADVQFKSHDQLLTELKGMLKPHAYECESLREVASRADNYLKLPLDETRKSFIRAFASGFEQQQSFLGTTTLVNHDSFTKYVAVESMSCFVETITYYYDCELTRAGVTLVDTPGADSINSRHTGVAFDYIRNADAVLFITYYNHAFAKADREFLIQLGRVKDSFELDKMFFIVNAIDLANSVEEKNEVIQYVEQELTQFGIRHPRLFGVSSLEALDEEIHDETSKSGMYPFKIAFNQFLREELLQVALQSVDEQSQKLLNQFKQLITSTEQNMKRKPERLAELAVLEKSLRTRYQKDFTKKLSQLLNESDTLLYYVKQRVFYRYSDFFKEAFNPSRFANAQNKRAFEEALDEVLESIGFDISQELRVTNLRMQMTIQQTIRELEKQEVLYLDQQPAAFSLTPMEIKQSELLDFKTVDFSVPKYESLQKYYKNAKQFFEKNDKAIVQTELEKLAKSDVERHLELEKTRLHNWTDHYYNEIVELARLRFLHTTLATIQTERQLLEQQEILASWKLKWNELKEESDDHQ